MSDSTLAVRRDEPSVLSLIGGLIDKGVSTENVAALAQLVELKERMDAKQAEKDFVADFVALKQQMPAISATKAVPNRDGTIRYHFAPLEEIDAALRPVALQYGFTYSFTEAESNRAGTVTKVCIVQHKSGHSARHPYSVRIGSGPPGSTESQSDGAAHSYAKRGALCDAFGIIIERDSDGARGDDCRDLGKNITKEEAAEFKERCRKLRIPEKDFLSWAEDSKSFEEIPESMRDEIKNYFRQCEVEDQKKGGKRDKMGTRVEPGETGEDLL